MGLLVDTHAFLWFAEDSPRLSPTARNLIRTETEVFVSMASIWELGIKQSLDRFGIPDEEFGDLIADCLRLSRATLLPITTEHVMRVTLLPMHHRDPFDRMLVAQAMSEGLTLVSQDQHMAAYPCEVVW